MKKSLFAKIFMVLLLIALMSVFIVACGSLNDNDFSITLDLGDEIIVYRAGDVLPSLEREDCYFDGWYLDKEYNTPIDIDLSDFTLDKDIYLYAKWTEYKEFEGVTFDSVQVVYDGNPHTITVNGVPSGASVEYLNNTTYTNAGEYNVRAVISMYGYKTLTLDSKIVIERATIDDIIFDDVECVWDGNTHSVVALNVPIGVDVVYTNNHQSEVGVYEVNAQFITGDNYYPIDDMSATLTIVEREYTLTFNDGDGSVFTINVARNHTLENIPSPVSRRGYTCCWDKDLTINIVEDMTITAVYQPILYDITYHLGDEVVDLPLKSYTIEDDILLPSSLQKAGYTFDGWYEDSDCTSRKITGWNKGEFARELHLYARWVVTSFSISYDLDCDDAIIDNDMDHSFTIEDDDIVLTTPYRAGSEFLGWYCVEKDEIIDTIYVKQNLFDVTLVARWRVLTFNITYQLNGGTLDKDNPTEYDNYSPIILHDPTRAGYTFEGWYDNKGNPYVGSIKGYLEDVTFYATWKPIVYHVSYTVNMQDYVLQQPNVSEFTIESKGVEFHNPSKEHYIFLGWYSDEECTIRAYGTSDYVMGDKHYYGKWDIVVYDIEYNTMYGDNDERNRHTYTIEDNQIDLYAPTRTGFEFDGWYIATSTYMDPDKVTDGWYENKTKVDSVVGEGGTIYLVAKWIIPGYLINYDLNGGSFEGDYMEFYLPQDVEIPLPVPYRQYYTFAGWRGDDNMIVNAIPVGTKGILNYTACWYPTQYSITYLGADGYENCNAKCFDAENCDITLTPIDAENFLHWEYLGEVIEKIEYKHLGKDITISAVFDDSVNASEEWVIQDNIITLYKGSDTNVIIPSSINGMSVKGISSDAFTGKESSIISLTFPQTIESMQSGLLKDFCNLQELTIPFVGNIKYTNGNMKAGVRINNFTYLFATQIDDDTLYHQGVKMCYVTIDGDGNMIQTIDTTVAYLPKSLTRVEVVGGDLIHSAFAYCNGITEIVVDCGYIGDQSFRGCASLETITLNSGVEQFGGSAIVAYATSLNTIYYTNDTQLAMEIHPTASNVAFVKKEG